MIAALRAEVRKMFSVRTTYYLLIFTFLIVLFYAGFIEGFKANHTALLGSGYLTSQITGAVGAVTILGSFIGLFLIGNEYRWNTIIYSLTATNSRSKILGSKIIVVTVLMLAFTLVVATLSPLATLAGIHLHNYHLAAQSINYGALWWRCLLFGWGYGMLALLFIALIRNQIGALLAFILIPSTAEGLLALLLKNNAKYLPFTSLQTLVDTGRLTGPVNDHTEAFVALAYIVGGWIIAWVLFMRRDAN